MTLAARQIAAETDDPRNGLLDAVDDLLRACLAQDLEPQLRARFERTLARFANTAQEGVRPAASPPPAGVGPVANTPQAGVGLAAPPVAADDAPPPAPAAGARAISPDDMDRAVRLASLAEFLKRQGRSARNAINRDELAAHEAFVRSELSALQRNGGAA